MKIRKRIIVIGSANVDMVLQVPSLPGPGATVSDGRLSHGEGGKGANQAIAAARAGGSVTFVASLGDDAYGHRAIETYVADNLDVEHVKLTRLAPTGTAFILVDPQGEHSTALAPGANQQLAAAQVLEAASSLQQADLLLLQLEIPLPAIETAIELAHAAGVPILLNAAPAQKISASLLPNLSCLVLNISEASALLERPLNHEADYEAGIKALHAMGPSFVVLTLGQQGLCATDGETLYRLPAFAVTAIDTTAAGDVFCGVLSVAMAEVLPWEKALKLSQAAAALSVQRPGALRSAPERSAIEDFLESYDVPSA
jgi:ribokinase